VGRREAGRERFVCEQPPYSCSCGDRDRRLPTIQRTGWAPSPGARSPGLAVGQLPGRRGAPDEPPGGDAPGPLRMSIPGNQRKLEVAEELAKLAESSGMTLVNLAVSF